MRRCHRLYHLWKAVGETVILLHPPPLPLLGVSIGIKRGCQRNDSLADGYFWWAADRVGVRMAAWVDAVEQRGIVHVQR